MRGHNQAAARILCPLKNVDNARENMSVPNTNGDDPSAGRFFSPLTQLIREAKTAMSARFDDISLGCIDADDAVTLGDALSDADIAVRYCAVEALCQLGPD